MSARIVVGYDGSRSAESAVKVAIREALLHGAEIDILTSVTDHEEEIEEVASARKKLEFAGDIVTRAEIPYELHLLTRKMGPGEDIVEYARRLEAIFIVIGVRRRSKVGKLLFGSTAQYVILNTPCPVICVP